MATRDIDRYLHREPPDRLCSIESIGIGTILSVVGTVVSIASKIAGAAQQADAAAAERAQFEAQQKQAEIAALQDEAQRRQELTRVLASQDAIRAGRGLDLYSPTGLAIRTDTINQAETDIATSRLNYLTKARYYGLGAEAASTREDNALIGGFSSAAGGVLSAAKDPAIAKMFGYAP